MSADWAMPRRADACTGCQRPFAVGETLHAYLFESTDGYARLDFCARCPPPTDRVPVGSWKTRRAEPVKRLSQTFDRQAVYQLFEQLSDAQDARRAQFRFVLALLLWRKKTLRLERTGQDRDGEFWEFVHVAAGTLHQVRRPELDEEQLEQLSAQLEQLLTGEAQRAESAAPGADEGGGP